MLVKHVRHLDEKGNHLPFATVVATGAGKVGICICREGEEYSKQFGIDLAAGRAVTGTMPKMPNYVVFSYGVMAPVKVLLEAEKEEMLARSERYFKNPS